MSSFAAFDPVSFKSAKHSGASCESAAWRSVRADVIRRRGVGRQETRISPEDHMILLNLGGVAREGEDYVNGRRIAFRQRQVGTLSFVPANNSWNGWDTGDPIAACLMITVRRQFITTHFDDVAGIDIDELVPVLGFQDAPVQVAAQRIRSEMSLQDPLSTLSVESQITAIFSQLFRRAGRRQHYARGGLAPRVLKRLIELIEASPEGAISLADLAREADLSEFHVSRAFRTSMGLSPHKYIVLRRLERASEMLRCSPHAITEIAYMCGFSSPSHLSTVFQRELGMTPSQYRAAWRM